jgi:uncharacterized membrane protein
MDQDQKTNFSNPSPTPPVSGGGMSGSGIDEHKLFGVLGYIIPILFFLPLVTDAKDNEFAKFHANQQLNLLLMIVVGQIAAFILTIVLIGLLLMPLVWLAYVVFMIMGIINVANGQMKELPVIGKFRLIK